MKTFSKVEDLRRRAVTTAAGAAVLGAAPAVSMTHGHRWLGFVFIGLQVLMIVQALRFLNQMKRLKSEGNE
jgi:hypothetical protein